MSKETGSYESLIRGVSEQVPHDRFVGQHWVQDNFVGDPVRGLARRQGSTVVYEKLTPTITYNEAARLDLADYGEYTFFINSVEYSLMYRKNPKPVGSTAPGVICINKDSGVILDVAVGVGTEGTNVVGMLGGGVSAITNIAKYLMLAPKSQPALVGTTDNVLATRNLSVGWVKQGSYSRTYTIKVTDAVGTIFTAAYTTPASYYPGTLTTSDILASDPEYQKKVNDRVYAYQTAVNQWIGTAAAAIQPAAIAAQLIGLLIGGGMSALVVGQTGSHILLADAFVIEVDDGGDGTFFKGVSQEVQSSVDLSPIHYPGKTVRVRPKGSGTTDASGIYYLRAVPKDGIFNSVPKEVVWTEAPGVTQQPGFVTLLGQIIGNTLFLATSQTALQTISGDTNQTPFAPSISGDLTTEPIPVFFNKTITYMTNFQDRLMIVAGSTVFLSRAGDYFNFYNKSALIVNDDDPIEVFALGSEGDTITDAVTMDRSLILFGKQQQYAMDGRTIMTPKTAFVATQSAHEDTTTCPPVGSGNYIFFSQQRSQRLTLQQMQTGDYADSFRAFEITSQLDGYLIGTPRQIVALTSPASLHVRTKEFTNGFWCFNYLDNPENQNQRLYDAWSKWNFNPALGILVGITGSAGDILALTFRNGANGVCLVLDRFSRNANLSANPYLDSMRPYSNTTSSIQIGWENAAQCAVALNSTAGAARFVGQPLLDYQKLIDAVGLPVVNASGYMGTYYDSQVEPTAPYMRDKKEKAILDSELILGTYNITLVKSAAMRAYLRGMTDSTAGEVEILDWVNRPAGAWVPNTQQVAETITLPVDIQQEIREFRVRLVSRNWLPLTLSSIEWSGQFYTQRNA